MRTREKEEEKNLRSQKTSFYIFGSPFQSKNSSPLKTAWNHLRMYTSIA